MILELWVLLALGAALAQTARNALSQSLSAEISPTLNSWARFTFCLPFAAVAWLWVTRDITGPMLPPLFFAFCLLTGLTQLLGSVALITAFRLGSFGESIVFHKLEVILTALAGAVWFREQPSPLGWIGVLVCGLGVVAMNLARESDGKMWRRALRFGVAGGYALLCAVLLVAASFALKAANAVVMELQPETSFASAAVQTLFHTTWIEVLILSVWIGGRERRSFAAVPTHWKRMLLIGACSFAASLGWFWAFSLTLVAYVKAVGQLEAVLAVALGVRLLGDRTLLRQLPGTALVILGIALVLLG